MKNILAAVLNRKYVHLKNGVKGIVIGGPIKVKRNINILKSSEPKTAQPERPVNTGTVPWGTNKSIPYNESNAQTMAVAKCNGKKAPASIITHTLDVEPNRASNASHISKYRKFYYTINRETLKKWRVHHMNFMCWKINDVNIFLCLSLK